MSNFQSFDNFEEYIKSRLIQAQEDAIQVMLLKLDDFIREEVYSSEPERYIRSWQVYEMFDSIKSYIKGNTVYGGIGVAGVKGFKDVDIIHRASTWTHDTRLKGYETPDAKDIVKIIEEGLSYENSIFGEMPARPFWSSFKKWCIENYNDIFLDCCLKNGIPIKR